MDTTRGEENRLIRRSSTIRFFLIIVLVLSVATVCAGDKEKQAANPGKGPKKNSDLEITPLTGKSNGKKEKNKNKKEGGTS